MRMPPTGHDSHVNETIEDTTDNMTDTSENIINLNDNTSTSSEDNNDNNSSSGYSDESIAEMQRQSSEESISTNDHSRMYLQQVQQVHLVMQQIQQKKMKDMIQKMIEWLIMLKKTSESKKWHGKHCNDRINRHHNNDKKRSRSRNNGSRKKKVKHSKNRSRDMYHSDNDLFDQYKPNSEHKQGKHKTRMPIGKSIMNLIYKDYHMKLVIHLIFINIIQYQEW